MFKDKKAFSFLIIAFMSGICSSLFYPLTSLFIIEALEATPAMLSAYMIITVCTTVLVSQYLALKSDQGWSRKNIVLVSQASYLIILVCFSFIRDFYFALSVAVVFASISGAAFGQLFAIAREYADEYIKDSTSFLSIMRAWVAIAWVIGPPAAFFLKDAFGFSASFLLSALVTVFTIILIVIYIPKSPKIKEEKESKKEKESSLNFTIILFSIAIVFMFTANNLYIISMPLYLTQELKVNASWIGIMFGVAAFFEIPIMMRAGQLSARFGTMQLLTLSLISACIFFILMLNATQFWSLLVIQVFNSVFIGIAGTLGMVAMQDMMKDRLGMASTLFTNLLQVSMLVSSLAIGVVGELYTYYAAFYLCLAFAISALVLLAYFLLIQKLKL